MTGPDDRDQNYFGKARTAAGLGLIALVGFLLWLDANSGDFDLSSDKLGLLLMAGLLCLGVEGLKRGKP